MLPSVQTPPALPEQQRTSLKKITLRSLGWAGAGSAVSAATMLVRLVILSRLLTPVEFGIFAVSNSLVTFFSGLAYGLFAGVLVQDRNGTQDKQSMASVLFFSVAFGSLFASLMIGFSSQLGAAYRIPAYSEVFAYMAPALALRCLAQVPWAILQREHKFRSEFACTTSSLLVGTVVSVFLAWQGFGFRALVWGLVAETAVLALVAMFASGSSFGAWPSARRAWALVRKFGGSFSITVVCIMMNPGLQCFLVSVNHSPHALGLFTRTQALHETFATTVFGTFINRLFRVFPMMEGDTNKLGRAMAISIETISLVALPVSAMLFLCADSIVRVVLGPSWVEGALLFGIFSLGLMARLCYKITEFVSYALGRAFTTSIRAVLNLFAIALAIVALARYGLEVTVAVVVLIGLANYLASAAIALKALGWTWGAFLMLHARGTSLAVLVTAVILAVQSRAIQGAVLRDVIACGAGLALAAVCCWAWPKLLLGERILGISPKLEKAVRH